MKELPLIQSAPQQAVDDCCATGSCAVPEAAGGTPSTARGAGGELRSVLRIDGMDCASCAMTLERVVRGVDGVDRAVVNFAAARLDVQHGTEVSAEHLDAAVRRAGFRVRPTGDVARVAWWRGPRVAALLLAVALAAAATIGSWGADDVAGAFVAAFVAAILLAGLPVFRAAWAAARARTLDMNVLMATATVGAGALGQWPEAASIVVLFSVGNLLQVHAIARTRATVAAMAEFAPTVVRVERGASVVEAAVAEVRIGETVLVRPGERVALDGVVVDGTSTLDEAPITGEAVPVERAVGDRVLSGSLNGAGALRVAVEQVAADSTLQRIVQLVEQAQASTAPSEQFVERFARIYTPLVVAAAALLAVVPSVFTGDWSTWTYRGLALLIIACPCSLVISTPVTVVSGIGAASRRGILVKGGAALEAAGRLRVLAMDKTGTLTEGRPTVATTSTFAGHSEAGVLRIAAALERSSEHPLAHAILVAADGIEPARVEQFRSIAGRGAIGVVDGVEYRIGSPRLFAEHGIEVPVEVGTVLDAAAGRGETPVLLGGPDGVLAVFGLADTIRPDAAGAIASLRAAGIERIVMLTGDSEGAARRVASELGIEHRSGLLPEDKVASLEELRRRHGVVGMVGDGVNDAPALAAASVSFAMGAAGSGVALEAADITLMQDDLRSLAASVELSRAAGRVLRQNVLASILFKGVFVLLAPFGLVTLWLAVVADLGTSLGVTANGLRLFRRR